MKFLSLLFLLSASTSFAMKVNFNQGWFKNHYSTQYLDKKFNSTEVEKMFKLAKGAGSEELRMWFFESASFPMIEFDGLKIKHLKPEYVKNVLSMLALARKHELKIYMTLFDAHSYRPDKLSLVKLMRLQQFYHGGGQQAFVSKILIPLLKAIEEAGLSSVISKIDLINEGDTVVNRFGFNRGWTGFRNMICTWRAAIHSLSSFKHTPVTLSVRLHPLVFLPENILEDDGPLACADVLDFHSYHDEGKIKGCSKLKSYSKLEKKKLILGEFGQGYFTSRFSNSLQWNNTKAYINNAQYCGFSEAFAWRLSDVRKGANPEARYSFTAFGKMRPAYYLIQKHNRTH
jgi:hypothetical protein